MGVGSSCEVAVEWVVVRVVVDCGQLLIVGRDVPRGCLYMPWQGGSRVTERHQGSIGSILSSHHEKKLKHLIH